VKLTGAQTVAGVKTFSSAPVLPAASIPQAALAAGVAGNGPAFSAYKSGTNQSFTANTGTKVTFETESFDTNGCYNNTGSTATLNGLSVPAYAFCPNVAGYYQINAEVEASGFVANYFVLQIRKNGNQWMLGSNYPTTSSAGPATVGSSLVYLNGTGDYVEIYAQASANFTVVGTTESLASKFQAFLARAA
jgi:hypothetical protein